MALDGIMFEGVSVRVRRPNDYNPAAAAALGPSAPNPALNLAAIGLGGPKTGRHALGLCLQLRVKSWHALQHSVRKPSVHAWTPLIIRALPCIAQPQRQHLPQQRPPCRATTGRTTPTPRTASSWAASPTTSQRSRCAAVWGAIGWSSMSWEPLSCFLCLHAPLQAYWA